jgi:hypothetical protein
MPDYRELASGMLNAAGVVPFQPATAAPRRRQPQLDVYTQELPYGRGEVGGGVTQPVGGGASLFARGSLVPFQGAPLSEADRRLMGGVRLNY